MRQVRATKDSPALDIVVAIITSIPSSCSQLLSLLLFKPLREAVADDARHLFAWRPRAVGPEPTGVGHPEGRPRLQRRPASILQDHTVPQLVIRESMARATTQAAGWTAGGLSLSLSGNWGSSRRAGQGAQPPDCAAPSVTPVDC